MSEPVSPALAHDVMSLVAIASALHAGLASLSSGEHASASRDFNRGIAYAVRYLEALVLEAAHTP